MNAGDAVLNETVSEGEETNQQQKQVDYQGILEEHNGRGEFENIHRDRHEVEFDKILNLNTGDKVLIVVTGIIIVLISVAYWIFIILWLVRRAYLDGANYVLFGFGALCLNLAAVIAYYIYRSFSNRCPACGKMQKKDIEFCANCGEAVNTKCSNCGARIHKNDTYCSKCGTKQ